MQIVSITGASGVGKTTLQESLIQNLNYTQVVSNTTRPKRAVDRVNEYRYLSLEELQSFDDVLWSVQIHGNYYVTRVSDLLSSANTGTGAVIVISIDCIKRLQIFCVEQGMRYTGIHLLAPAEKVLRERLILRGESEINIERRIKDCASWDAKASEIKGIHFVPPLGKLEAFEHVQCLLRSAP